MPSFSNLSKSNLKTAAWSLQLVFNEVVKYHDCTVLIGHRGEELQNKMFAEGKSKVKWPDGKHNSYPSRAVDVAPWPIPDSWGDKNWKDKVHFYELAAVVKFVSAQMGIKIRWGGDWDGDGDYKDQTFDDLTHFELL